MRDEPFNPYTDVAREAFHDYYDDPPEPEEMPSPEDVADLAGPPPFTRHPDAVTIGGWTYIRPR